MPDRRSMPSLPDPVAYLTGEWSGWHGADRPDGVRQPWAKFDRAGRVQRFPGVTVVCPVPMHSSTFRSLVAIQDGLKVAPFARQFAYLPPPSFHMTLFDVSNELRRGTTAWPDGIAADADWPVISREMEARLKGLELPAFSPRAVTLFGGFSLALSGRDDMAEETLRTARDTLRARTGVRRSDHESYVFHITLAYPLSFLSAAEAREVVAQSEAIFAAHQQELAQIHIGPAEFCDFDDMHAFIPRLTLGPATRM